METPKVVVVPASPISTSPNLRHFRAAAHGTVTSTSTSSQSDSAGSFRSSSEDTAVTIFSMYTNGHENWTTSAKVLTLNDVEPMLAPRSRKHSVETLDSSVSDTQHGTPIGTQRASSVAPTRPRSANSKRSSRQPTVANGHAPAPQVLIDHRLGTVTSSARNSIHRDSEESTYLPYARHSLPPSERSPSPPPPIPYSASHSARSRRSVRPPLPEQFIPTPDPSSSSQPSNGEDADSFHVRTTYAQLDASGVPGDGFEEGVELTRAKQGGTTYLTPQPHDRGSDSEVSPKELAVLSSVDRYGFLVASFAPNDRLLLLPSATLFKPLSLVRPSSRPSSSPPVPPPLSTLPPTDLVGTLREKELYRTAKWRRMLESDSRDGSGSVLAWRIASRKERKLRERVYKGVPDAWRAVAWAVLIDRFAGATRASSESLTRQYRDTINKPSSYDVQIDLDVPRTISGHVMFHTRYGLGQRALFHVLHALSLLCPDCGYVQGMGPVAATLLCYYEPEKVYAVLVHIHHAYSMHTIYSPGFPGLLESIYVQERVTQHMLPDVYAVFKKHNISSTAYTTKWYITLFANTVPFQTQLRLWDAFFLEGRDMMVIVAVAILWVFKAQITTASATFETILSLLSSFFVPESEDMLMKWIQRALGDHKLRADMQTWRKEWRVLVTQGNGQDVLL